MPEGSFAPFVPAILTDRLRSVGREAAGPDAWRATATVLVIDITGFTALTERLAKRGPGGAEMLASILNDSFGGVIDRIHVHGGDVVNFAGDAILAAWPDATAADVVAATTCALESQRVIEAQPVVEDIRVRARAGIAIGPIWVGIVGGVGNEWRWVVGGPPLGDAGRAAVRAEPGQVVVTAAAARTGSLDGRPVEDRSDHVVVEAVGEPARSVHGPSADSPDSPESAESRADRQPPADQTAGPSDDVLAAFVPPELVRRVRAGQASWLAEFRRLTVLFIGIRGFDPDAPDALVRAQAAFRSTQEILDRYEGTLHQIVDDDKGLTVVASWGFPDRTHEDDPLRGLLAARAIVDRLPTFGLVPAAGVTTGDVFTGIRGSPSRSEYAMVGDVVNLAARFMQTGSGEVRCDAPTARAAAARLVPAGLAARSLGRLELKGKAGGVEAFRIEPAVAQDPPEPGADGPVLIRRTLVGRLPEWTELTERVARFASDGEGGVVVIEGEPGVGKSELVAHLVDDVPGSLRIHVGEADAIERATPYYIWRRPILDSLDIAGTQRAAIEDGVLARLRDDPGRLDRASLLDAILPIELPVSDRAADLEADVRADAIRDLAVGLIGAAVALRPRVIILEDVHWADSSSWALILAVARRVPGVLLILSTRPMGDGAPPELERALAEPGARQITLGPLAADDAIALVCQALDVDAIPAAVATFITDRAEGNPFFSEQLAYALRDAGHLVVDGRSARLGVGVTDLDALDIPDSVHGVLASRIDGLSPSEQLTLKVASVIGRLFRVGLLADVHPMHAARDPLTAELERASGLDLTRRETPEPDLAYLFTHVITQEVAYDLLVFAQRRPLHRAVAEWYEANVSELEPLVPLLAHHWSRAGVTDKALEYLGRAGEQALQNYANAEALGFLAQALALDEANGRVAPAGTRADWERWTGIALVKSARYREALTHFEACLELLGAPNPRGRARRLISIGRHLCLQGWRRIHRSRIAPAARDRALAISETHRYLTEVSYWRNELTPWVHATLASLNHAEPAGDSKETVVAFATVGFGFGLVALHGIARRYRALTDAASARVANPDASGYAAELGSVYHLTVADWPTARRIAEEGSVIFREVGDRMRWHTCFSLIGYADLHQGRFELAATNARRALEGLGPDGGLQGRLWSMCVILATDLAADRLDLGLADEMAGLLGPAVHHHDEILVRGLLAAARARAGDPDGALAHAQATIPLVDVVPPPSWHTLLGIAGAADVAFDRWAATPGDETARRLARRSLKGFRGFARFNRAGRPRVAILDGRARWIQGDPAGARRAWQRARLIATGLDMPYETALADLALASSHPPGSAERVSAAERALQNLEPHGATFDAARARALLGDRDLVDDAGLVEGEAAISG